MYFRSEKGILMSALDQVSKALGKSNVAVLEGVLVNIKGGVITFTASNSNIMIESKISTLDYKDGKGVIADGKLFTEYVKKLPDATIMLESDDENKLLTVKCKKNKTTFALIDAESYPDIDGCNNINSFEISQGKLRAAIANTSYAIAKDNTRPILGGILLQIEDSTLTLVALDGFRLSVCKIQNVPAKTNTKIILPGISLCELSKLLKSDDTKIKIAFSNNNAKFEMADTSIVIRALEGEFISYEKIIPQNPSIEVKLIASDLLSALERVSMLSKKSENALVRMWVNNEILFLSAKSSKGESTEQVDISTEFKETLEIAFNATYWIEMLKEFGDSELILEFTTSISPCVIKKENADDFIGLVLPIRITNEQSNDSAA